MIKIVASRVGAVVFAWSGRWAMPLILGMLKAHILQLRWQNVNIWESHWNLDQEYHWTKSSANYQKTNIQHHLDLLLI